MVSHDIDGHSISSTNNLNGKNSKWIFLKSGLKKQPVSSTFKAQDDLDLESDISVVRGRFHNLEKMLFTNLQLNFLEYVVMIHNIRLLESCFK